MTQSFDRTVAGNTTATQPENRAFYPALDGLRGVAFLMVFLQHYLSMGWGWTGVNIFFVLSGFLITGILFDTRHDAHQVRNFYIRRTLRIFPLYYGVMLLLLLLYPLMHWNITWQFIVWPAYLGNLVPFAYSQLPNTILQNISYFQISGSNGNFFTTLCLGHFWSLCVEEQFYLVWPWLVFRLRDRSRLFLLCALMIPLCLILRLIGQNWLPSWMLDHNILQKGTPFCVDALFLGGALALMLRGPHAETLYRIARIALPICMLAIALTAVIFHTGNIFALPYPYPHSLWTWSASAVNFLAALVLLCALQPKSWVYRILHTTPLRWLGRISYGAYVLHDIPHNIYLFLGETVSPAYTLYVGSAIALLCTITLAWLSFRFFESPFLNLKERWTIRG